MSSPSNEWSKWLALSPELRDLEAAFLRHPNPRTKPSRKPRAKSQAVSNSSREHVPKSQNSFFVFKGDFQKEFSKRLGGISQATFSKIAGRLWNALPDEDKEVYEKRAAAAKLDHRERYPDYTYRRTNKKKTRRAKKPAYHPYPRNRILDSPAFGPRCDLTTNFTSAPAQLRLPPPPIAQQDDMGQFSSALLSLSGAGAHTLARDPFLPIQNATLVAPFPLPSAIPIQSFPGSMPTPMVNASVNVGIPMGGPCQWTTGDHSNASGLLHPPLLPEPLESHTGFGLLDSSPFLPCLVDLSDIPAAMLDFDWPQGADGVPLEVGMGSTAGMESMGILESMGIGMDMGMGMGCQMGSYPNVDLSETSNWEDILVNATPVQFEEVSSAGWPGSEFEFEFGSGMGMGTYMPGV